MTRHAKGARNRKHRELRVIILRVKMGHQPPPKLTKKQRDRLAVLLGDER